MTTFGACQGSLKMSPSLTLLKCPLFVVDDVVGMRTEAKPCSLGRSVSAHSNERRCDPAVRYPGLHVLIAPSPGMVFLSLFHHYHSGGRWKWRGCFRHCFWQLGKSHSLPAAVHLRGSVLPFAHQRLASRGPIAPLPGLQLQKAAVVPDHPVVAKAAFGLQPENRRSSRALGLRP
jgi:hypothetical protein